MSEKNLLRRLLEGMAIEAMSRTFIFSMGLFLTAIASVGFERLVFAARHPGPLGTFFTAFLMLIGLAGLAWALGIVPAPARLGRVDMKLRHRDVTHGQWLNAFRGPDPVLLVTGTVLGLFNEMETVFAEPGVKPPPMRVLTIDPDLPVEVIEAHRQQIKAIDTREEYLSQVRNTYTRWMELSRKYKSISVLPYSPPPTMTATIVGDKWALVELLPYGQRPPSRPGFIVHKDKSPEMFEYFQRVFEDLWKDADDTAKRRNAGL